MASRGRVVAHGLKLSCARLRGVEANSQVTGGVCRGGVEFKLKNCKGYCVVEFLRSDLRLAEALKALSVSMLPGR